MKKFLWLPAPFLFFPQLALAHCPLCTAGAGVLAVLAVSLGISSVVVGIMIGAFALALGLWLGGLPKKQYIPWQYSIIPILVFLGTVIPIMPLIRDYDPFYISWWGDYGTLFHNTYTIDLYLVGVVIGASIILVVPPISRLITKARGKLLPYQGITLTFVLLLLASAIVEILL
ncbi:MAG: hypothetical protein AAB691_00290 [Patescibacteria group bacterium]